MRHLLMRLTKLCVIRTTKSMATLTNTPQNGQLILSVCILTPRGSYGC